jgi:hypothetical protein
MYADAGAVSAISLVVALLPSVAAFGWGVANDAAAMYTKFKDVLRIFDL